MFTWGWILTLRGWMPVCIPVTVGASGRERCANCSLGTAILAGCDNRDGFLEN